MPRAAALVLLALPLFDCASPAPPLPACRAASVAPPPLPGASSLSSDAGPALPGPVERRAVFADLVASVRKYHLFSDLTRRNLGRRWEDELPELEKAFTTAVDEPALHDALARFANSLHDGHLWYSEPASEGRGDRLALDLTIEPEWVNGAARFYVAEVRDPALAPIVRPGDVLRLANGVAGDALLAAHALRSNQNNWRGIAADVAAYLTERTSTRTATRAGDEETWVLAHRAGGEATVKLTWKKEPWPGEEAAAEEDVVDIDYAPAHCSTDLPDRGYPASYRLTSHGRFYCLYTASAAPYDAYPIVRHFTVHYSALSEMTVSPRYMLPDVSWQISAEYEGLSRALRRLPRAKGIILDLRDNRGGNDPEWFLDWYAPAPYVDMFTSVRTYADYDDEAFRKRVVNVDDGWYAWYRKATKGLPPGRDVRRPFKCKNADCAGDNRFTPGHALLAAPVALLVGPQCQSSCAHIAQIFDENDFGPLIGEPTGASYTSQRLKLPVTTKSGLDLGTIGLGLSSDSSGKTEERLEGRVVHVDYPVERTFDGRARWDAALVDTAIRAFKEFKFPKWQSALGPR